MRRAVKVLKSETRHAGEYAAQYAALKSERADMVVHKAALRSAAAAGKHGAVAATESVTASSLGDARLKLQQQQQRDTAGPGSHEDQMQQQAAARVGSGSGGGGGGGLSHVGSTGLPRPPGSKQVRM
jgi:hypothetical protein